MPRFESATEQPLVAVGSLKAKDGVIATTDEAEVAELRANPLVREVKRPKAEKG